LISADLAAEIESVLDDSLRVDERLGCANLFPGSLDGFEELRSTCMRLFEERRDELGASKKAYLKPVLHEKDLQEHAEIVDYALNPKLLGAAKRYLGVLPRLRYVQFLWTPMNETAAGSQLFHFDHMPGRQLKLFAYLTEIREENGPFVFIPADASERIVAALGVPFEDAHRRRYPDEEIEALSKASERVTLTGPPGAGGLVDTTRCLHYGGRAREGERHMLMIQYTRPDADLEGVPLRPSHPHVDTLSLQQRAALLGG
jgi:hypothetical protein